MSRPSESEPNLHKHVLEGHVYDLFAMPFRDVRWNEILTPLDLNLHEFGIPLDIVLASFWDTFLGCFLGPEKGSRVFPLVNSAGPPLKM